MITKFVCVCVGGGGILCVVDHSLIEAGCDAYMRR